MADKTTGKLKLWIAKITDKISDTINIYLSENFSKIDDEFSSLKDDVDEHKTDDIKHITSTERTIWNNKLDASAYTAADVLVKVKTVDGDGSGLDADMVDGKHFSDIQNDAQAKADVALNSAKQYTDQKVGEVAQELAAHKAEKATQEQLGHVKAGNNITIDEDGTINAKGGNVDSVNGKTGEVVIDVGDIAGLVSSRLALGQNASATGSYSIALGQNASAVDYSVALGGNASAEIGSVALGRTASAGTGSVALGRYTSAVGNYSVALGEDASAEGNNSVALGQDASTVGNNSVALGRNASAEGNNSIALGQNASAAKIYSVALGNSASAAGTSTVVLGYIASAERDYSVALGRGASAENANEGILGDAGSYGTSEWKVPGSFTVNGTKNFEIPHPKPEKKATHVIRHGAVESPTPGDTLYRWKIQATKDNDLVTIDLPDYFIWLNKDVQIFVTPQGHFGNGYGVLNRETEQLEIHCQFEGEYNVLVIGTRNDDHPSVQEWYIKGVEREIGESWTGETYAFSVDEIIEIEEIKEVSI